MRAVSLVAMLNAASGLQLNNSQVGVVFDATGNLVSISDLASNSAYSLSGDGWSVTVGDMPFPTRAEIMKDKQGVTNATCPILNSPPPVTTEDQCAFKCMATDGCEAWTSQFVDHATWGHPLATCRLFTCPAFSDAPPHHNFSAGLKPPSTPVKLTEASCSKPVVTSPSATTIQSLYSDCSGYMVNATYELAAGWRFVSKHLAICKQKGAGCDPAAGFTVRKVQVWPGVKLDKGVQLGAMGLNLFGRQSKYDEPYAAGTGETASFWRKASSPNGLFMSVQNSFMFTGEGFGSFHWGVADMGPSADRWGNLNYGVWQLGASIIQNNFHPAAVYDTLNIVGQTAKGGIDVALMRDSAVADDKPVSVAVTLVEGHTSYKPAEPTPKKGGYAGIVFGAAATPATDSASAQVDGFAAVVDLAAGEQKARFLQLGGALENVSNAKVLKEAPIHVSSSEPVRLEVSAPAHLTGTVTLKIDGHVVLSMPLPKAANIKNAGGVGVIVLEQDASFHDFQASATATTAPPLTFVDPAIHGRYSPMMKQVPSLGEWFVMDPGVLGVTDLVGYEYPETGIDLGEYRAFTECVEKFLMDGEARKAGAVRLQVAWDSNDYQMDMANATSVAEYKRLITRNAELGIKNVIFGPRNTAVASRWEHTDAWWWEEILWFQLGIGIRNGSFVPGRDPVPPTVQSMLDFFKTQDVNTIAYVYPTLAWRGEGEDEWLYTSPKREDDMKFGKRASLASPKLQDYLIKTMVKFLQVTGGKGFAWDYGIQGDTRVANMYQEVHGWKRILKALRLAVPDMVMDHRQIAHRFGPWYNLAGSYSEPIAGDENPESYGATLASLSTDHILADNLRLTNYRYRVQLLPNDRVPGFMFHQTERHYDNGLGDDTAGKPGDKHNDAGLALWRPDPVPGPDGNYSGVTYSNCVMAKDWHTRDFDYLGYRYSVLSTIGTAGRNLVLGNIPARNQAEYDHFPKGDIDWMKKWFAFADTNAEALKRTMPILGYEWPRLGKVDGTVATFQNNGFIFLYNPSPDHADATLRVDASLGLAGKEGDAWLLAEIYPREEGMNIGVWSWMDYFTVSVPGGGLRVYKLSTWSDADADAAQPMAFNVSYTACTLNGAAVEIVGAADLAGSTNAVVVRLPKGASATTLTVNNATVKVTRATCLPTKDSCLDASVKFGGDASLRYNALASPKPSSPLASSYNGKITVTSAMLAQLKARQDTYNISWVKEDVDASWLIPSRLLLYIYVARPTPALHQPVVHIDGKLMAVAKQYNSRGNHAVVPAGGGAVSGNTAKTFLGWYVDCTHLTPDVAHKVQLSIPWKVDEHTAHPFYGLYWHNIEDGLSTEVKP